MRYTAPAGQAGLLSFRRAWKQVPLHELHNTQTEYITMKKTLITLLALAGAAAGEEIILTLPGASIDPTTQTTFKQDVETAISTGAGKDYGYYVGGNGTISNWGTPTVTIDGTTYKEGSWTGDAVILAGRTGVAGLTSIFVFGGDIAAVTKLSDISFTASGNASNTITGDITLGLAVRDSEGKAISGINDVIDVTFNSQTGSGTATLAGTITWETGYKLIAVVDGLAGSATTAYIVDGIKASATVVPEPATATLSLLALAGLAARRRRH